MPKFNCQHCGQSISAPDESVGTQATCPTCEGEINIPEPPTIQKYHITRLPSRTLKQKLEALPFRLKATIGAGVFVLLGRLLEDEDIGFRVAIDVLFILFGQVSLAAIFGALYGLIMIAVKKPFEASGWRGYSFSLVMISTLYLLLVALGPLVSKLWGVS